MIIPEQGCVQVHQTLSGVRGHLNEGQRQIVACSQIASCLPCSGPSKAILFILIFIIYEVCFELHQPAMEVSSYV